MKIIGQSESFISKEEKPIKPLNYLQSEAERCYFVTACSISSELCVPIGKFVPKSSEMSFLENREIVKNREFFQIFQSFNIDQLVMFKYTSYPNLLDCNLFAVFSLTDCIFRSLLIFPHLVLRQVAHLNLRAV